jgi:hypothetical protein
MTLDDYLAALGEGRLAIYCCESGRRLIRGVYGVECGAEFPGSRARQGELVSVSHWGLFYA